MMVDNNQRKNDPSILPRDSFSKLANSVVLETMVTVVITSTVAVKRIKFLFFMGFPPCISVKLLD
nr:MAG TPA: hypothetical protein [Caudoviricetes sp.]